MFFRSSTYEPLLFAAMGPSMNVRGTDILLNGRTYSTLEFIDLGGTGERLQHWQKQALEEGMEEDRVLASLTVNVKEVEDWRVHQMNMIDLLRILPEQSVRRVHGDYFYLEEEDVRIKGDTTQHGFPTILHYVQRVLQPDGEFTFVQPLSAFEQIAKAIEDVHMQLEVVAMGYTGYLGGKNDLFPEKPLPAVEGVTKFIRRGLEETQIAEEAIASLSHLFATQLGEYFYVTTNPVECRARNIQSK